MNPQYHGGQGYAPRYPLTNRNAYEPSSNPSPLSLTQTLPPLGSAANASTFNNGSFNGSRVQPLQPSLALGPQVPSSHPPTYPIYGPTSHAQYHEINSTLTQPPMDIPTSQASFAQISASQQPSFYHTSVPYNTSAPPSLRYPDLRPMPARNGSSQTLAQAVKGISLLSSASQSTDEDSRPTHVVGSQGRRGILPSAAGRPSAIAIGTPNSPKGQPQITKDADGKYPCPHCTKTYLHSKHLKRHYLRHTDTRPYTCGLCHDTFSRSDILKRHFLKCSQRRGNPTGESHLSHSRAKKKAKANEEEALAANQSSAVSEQAQQLANYTPSYTPTSDTFDLSALGLTQPQPSQVTAQQPSSNRVSRSNSIKREKNANHAGNRGSSGGLNTSAYEANSYAYSTGQVTPDSITTSGAATPYTYLHDARSHQLSPEGTFNPTSNGMGMAQNGGTRTPSGTHYSHGSLPQIAGQPNCRGPEMDWSVLSQFPSQDDYGNSQYHSGTSTPHRIKSEPEFTNIPPNYDFSNFTAKS